MNLRSPRAPMIVVGFAAFIAMGVFFSEYWISILVLAGIYAIVATGLNLFMGYTGQTSFGHNAFAAIGGYTTAILTAEFNWPSIPALVLGAIFTAIAAAGFGYSVIHLKVRGHYLGMVTLGLGLIVVEIAIEAESLTNGTTGISGIPGIGIGPYEIASSRGMYWLLLVLVPLAVWCSYRINRSRLGRALSAISGDEQAAEALGINASAHILLAFVTSAVFASVGGSLLVHQLAFVSPEVFGMFFLTLLFTVLFVGGIGTILGPLVGALLIVPLPELLRQFSDLRELVYGVLLLLIVVFAPGGLCSPGTWSALGKAVQAVRRRFSPRDQAQPISEQRQTP